MGMLSPLRKSRWSLGAILGRVVGVPSRLGAELWEVAESMNDHYTAVLSRRNAYAS